MEEITHLQNRKNLWDIKFPIFSITENCKRIWTEYKVTYIETQSGVFILDNKNIKGDTLGSRRLLLKNSPLYFPRTCILNASQLIKSKHKLFIDSNGDVFKYIKTKTVPLKYFKIKEIIKNDNTCILTFYKINHSIRLSCRIAYGLKYVGFLITHMGYITYEYSEIEKNDSWRKI